MAKNYSEIIKSVYTNGNSMSFGNAMLRGNGVPLDITEVYNSYNDAVKYAAENPVAYEGQLLSVTENGDTTVYVITPKSQGTVTVGESQITVYLKEVGSVPEVDDKTLEIDAGVLKLAGLTDLNNSTSYEPKLVNGELTWTETSKGLDGRVTTLENVVGDETKGLAKDVAYLLANSDAYVAADTALEKSLQNYVAEQIGKQAHFSAKVVTSTTEMTDATTLYLMKTAETGEDLYEEWMIINNVATKIGTTATDLSDYTTSNDLATAISNFNTNTVTPIANALSDLQSVGAEKNIINSTSTEFEVNNREISIKAIGQSKVTGLTDALAGKVDKITTEYKGEQKAWTLLSPEDQEKLAALTFGTDSGNLELSAEVEAGKVKGLGTWITSQRNSLAGLLSSEQETKLSGIESGAQVNIIEKIKLADTEATVADDKSITIPFATNSLAGLVLGSNAENKVSVETDGTMTVNSLNVNKLTQTEGDTLILNGGNA